MPSTPADDESDRTSRPESGDQTPRDDDPGQEEGRDPNEVQEDKRTPRPRPDQPTPSDDATLAERDDGAHAEFADAPDSLADAPPGDQPPPDEGPRDDDDTG